MKNKIDWTHPQEISDTVGDVIGTLLPKRDEIPGEYNRNWMYNEWCKKASTLFYYGGKLPKTKNGVDSNLALRHLSAVLGSFEPKHEHKIAGAGYLMSLLV